MKETSKKCLSPSVSCDWMHRSRANFGADPFRQTHFNLILFLDPHSHFLIRYTPPEGFQAIEVPVDVGRLVANYWDRKSVERNLL